MDELIKFSHLEQVLKEYGQAVEDMYRDRLKKDDKVASGELIDNLRYIYQHEGYKWEISLYLKDYWYYVEHGRQPGKFPPVDKILDWIDIKPILPYPDKNGKLPTPNQLAYLVGRKIATEGIEAGNQLQETLDELNDRYMLKIEYALTEDLDESVGIITRILV